MPKIHTNSAEETQNTGSLFAKKLTGGDIILLYGNLGAGKTTFVQGIAKGLGITKRIISPTFIIIRSYELPKNQKAKRFYHIDLYRTETDDDLKGLGIDEILSDKEAIVAIEWPEKLGTFLPKKNLPAGRQGWEIRFTDDTNNSRDVTIN